MRPRTRSYRRLGRVRSVSAGSYLPILGHSSGDLLVPSHQWRRNAELPTNAARGGQLDVAMAWQSRPLTGLRVLPELMLGCLPREAATMSGQTRVTAWGEMARRLLGVRLTERNLGRVGTMSSCGSNARARTCLR
jgi:hypothetical protein